MAEEAAGRGSPGGDPMDAEAADAAGEGPAAAAAPPGTLYCWSCPVPRPRFLSDFLFALDHISDLSNLGHEFCAS